MRYFTFFVLTALAALSVRDIKADSFSTVYVSLGPVPGYSPSYSGYTVNAQAGVQTGGTSTGGVGPTSFSTVSAISNADINFDLDFNNWRGVANPAAPYQSEYGTLVFFSVVLQGTTGQDDLSLSQISYTESSTDPYDYFAYSCSFSNSACGSTDYSTDAEGYTAAGTPVTSGSGDQMVNKIVLTGVALGFDDSGVYSGSPQDQLDQAIAAENNAFGAYSINTCFSDSADGLSTCGAVNVQATPEPSTFGFVGATLAAGLALGLRRRRAA